MKPLAVNLILRWMGAILLIAAGGSRFSRGADSPPDIARILGQGEIRVAMTADDWPPFFFKHPSKGMGGLDAELAREIARFMGVRVVFVREARTFDDLVAMVDKRRADVAVAYLSDTLERAQIVRFTRYYTQLKQALLINRTLAGKIRWGRDLSLLLDRPEARIGVTKGTSAESFAATDYPRATIVSYDTWEQITKALSEGKLLAGFSDQIDAQKWQAANPEDAIEIETLILNNQPDTMAIAVHRDDRQLLYWLNHFLAKKEQDGTLGRLVRDYVEKDSWKKELR